MRNCTYCKWALWSKTTNGRLHPSGDGRCKYPYKVPELPQAFCWLYKDAPHPMGGHINRRKDLKDHCAYYTKGNYEHG
jgi:hypothetical protein